MIAVGFPLSAWASFGVGMSVAPAGYRGARWGIMLVYSTGADLAVMRC